MYKAKITNRCGNTTYILGDTKKNVLSQTKSYSNSTIEIIKCNVIILTTYNGITQEMM